MADVTEPVPLGVHRLTLMPRKYGRKYGTLQLMNGPDPSAHDVNNMRWEQWVQVAQAIFEREAQRLEQEMRDGK